MRPRGTIRVVGLGPGDPGVRTVAGQRCLDAASRIVLRTGVHPGLEGLNDDPRVETCDDLYDAGLTFDEVYRQIVDRVIARAADGDVVYAVPGHPLFGERSVKLLREAAAEIGVTVEIVAGVSAIDVVAATLGVDPLVDQIQCLDALQLDNCESDWVSPAIDPYRPILISQVYAPHVASAVKLSLADLLPGEHEVTLVRAAGVPGEERVLRCSLHELDHQAVDHLTSVWVPALEPLAAKRHWATLIALVSRLRAPDGCPWDRAQTHESLRSAVLDEAYEVVDAIDAGDMENLSEELGDLLLVVAMQAQIADEEDLFSIRDALESVNTKLVRRHPHVFGELHLDSPDDVLQTWRGIKAAERQTKGQPAKSEDPIERLPRSMPALLKAAKVVEKHPVDTQKEWSAAAPGDALLRAVAELVAVGEDPEVALLEALREHVSELSLRSGV